MFRNVGIRLVIFMPLLMNVASINGGAQIPGPCGSYCKDCKFVVWENVYKCYSCDVGSMLEASRCIVCSENKLCASCHQVRETRNTFAVKCKECFEGYSIQPNGICNNSSSDNSSNVGLIVGLCVGIPAFLGLLYLIYWSTAKCIVRNKARSQNVDLQSTNQNIQMQPLPPFQVNPPVNSALRLQQHRFQDGVPPPLTGPNYNQNIQQIQTGSLTNYFGQQNRANNQSNDQSQVNINQGQQLNRDLHPYTPPMAFNQSFEPNRTEVGQHIPPIVNINVAKNNIN